MWVAAYAAGSQTNLYPLKCGERLFHNSLFHNIQHSQNHFNSCCSAAPGSSFSLIRTEWENVFLIKSNMSRNNGNLDTVIFDVSVSGTLLDSYYALLSKNLSHLSPGAHMTPCCSSSYWLVLKAIEKDSVPQTDPPQLSAETFSGMSALQSIGFMLDSILDRCF